jgi:hypothetical protein
LLRKLRNIVFCVILALSSVHGAPMRADEVETLMAAMREPKVAQGISTRRLALRIIRVSGVVQCDGYLRVRVKL